MSDTINRGSDQGLGLLRKTGKFGLRIDKQRVIRAFFGGNAAITILVLLLIVWSLLKEGSGFLHTYQHELGVYRKAGLEYCDYVRKPLEEHAAILSQLKRAKMAEIDPLVRESRSRRDAALLAQAHVEEKAALPREALDQARTESAESPRIEELQGVLRKALADAARVEPLPGIFTVEEQSRLRSELPELAKDTPVTPFLDSLAQTASQEAERAKGKYGPFFAALDAFEEAAEPLVEWHEAAKEIAMSTKAAAEQQHSAEAARAKLLEAAALSKDAKERDALRAEGEGTDTAPIDFHARIASLQAKLAEFEALVPIYFAAVGKAMEGIPQTTETSEANRLLKSAREALPKHLQQVTHSLVSMREWRHDKPVPKLQAASSFFFGGDWITNSSWQDFYGFLPLLSGSLIIALTALIIALPFSVCAAIYTNQFASKREQEFIKPAIEFIQAIPSVVLGFIGISVLGDMIKQFSHQPWAQWIPGFPVQERLNMFNAGCLLALMATPTMFSLAEDAINNVPRSLAEASEALGATKLQTTFRVIVPAASSGILAAILLGLGRIIGETMVVLLVAGNRIAIPNFSDGLGAVFQPAHTLTGIIAQELGEVSRGSSHWQALFMVGIVLFSISLIINWVARSLARRLQSSRA